VIEILKYYAAGQPSRAFPKGLSTPDNKVAENGNKLLSETATLTGAATMLPFRATIICCRFRQQIVAWCGQALTDLSSVGWRIEIRSRFRQVNKFGSVDLYTVEP